MKVINKKESLQVACEKCNSLLEYEEEDVDTGEFGCAFVTCPVCGDKVYLTNDLFDKVVTTKNITYPKDFSISSSNAVAIEDDRINKYIKECINKCDVSSDSVPFSYIQSGRAFVFVCKFEDEYDIIVSNDYIESSIPR